ncbi:hypothetical protein ACFFK0_04840 [Paenibacillus chartarius]|uniref:Uncharacterized protein n=1 Tax=Paenibacillus chartarius TaxID=747481 RepID=A0ABV6DGL5_9BACL
MTSRGQAAAQAGRLLRLEEADSCAEPELHGGGMRLASPAVMGAYGEIANAEQQAAPVKQERPAALRLLQVALSA